MFDFVAIDFENADHDQFACQVGIVAIKDGKIVEELDYLIKPPGNRYGIYQIKVHGITPSMTLNAPEFDVIWEIIKPYFENNTLIMHNASTDLNILKKTLFYYFIPDTELKVIDTTKVIGKHKLDIIAEAYDVKIENYHNALDDARALAEIWLKFISGYKHNEFTDLKSKKSSFESKKIQSDLLVKDLFSCKNKDNPFYDRKVVVTGDFSISRKEIVQYLKIMGADVNTSISKNTNYVAIGDNPGPVKINTLNNLIVNGYDLIKLNENDLFSIFRGNYKGPIAEKLTKKSIKISLKHICNFPNKFEIELDILNLFARKEFFVGNKFKGNKNYLYQMIGFLGANINTELDNTIDIILISDNSVMNLKSEVIDETISNIEAYYNSGKSISFNFKFLTESDFIRYYKHRVEEFYYNDLPVVEVFNKYIHQKE